MGPFPQGPVTKFATHQNPHLDEIVGIWLLARFGEFMFPGAETAPVEFWDGIPEGKTGASLEREGYVLVGIGGGRFDEHPFQGTDRKEGECAATLVAKTLGLDEDPTLLPLLKFTAERDLNFSGGAFDLHGVIKTMYKVGRPNEDVWKWAFDAIEAVYDQNLAFFETAGTDFRNATVSRIRNSKGSVTLAVGRSDSLDFAKFARSPHGCRAGIVIQQNSSGNVTVQTDQRLNMKLIDTAQILRIEEYKASDGRPPRDWKTFWVAMGSDGTVPEVPEWYFFPEAKMLLNGSATTSAPPTKLPLERVSELVQIGINHKSFEPAHAQECQAGKCTSSLGNPCPWFAWGLHRCRLVRFQMANPKQ
jgi:hypothetical protein